jgi:hypothetical protein
LPISNYGLYGKFLKLLRDINFEERIEVLEKIENPERISDKFGNYIKIIDALIKFAEDRISTQ